MTTILQTVTTILRRVEGTSARRLGSAISYRPPEHGPVFLSEYRQSTTYHNRPLSPKTRRTEEPARPDRLRAPGDGLTEGGRQLDRPDQSELPHRRRRSVPPKSSVDRRSEGGSRRRREAGRSSWTPSRLRCGQAAYHHYHPDRAQSSAGSGSRSARQACSRRIATTVALPNYSADQQSATCTSTDGSWKINTRSMARIPRKACVKHVERAEETAQASSALVRHRQTCGSNFGPRFKRIATERGTQASPYARGPVIERTTLHAPEYDVVSYSHQDPDLTWVRQELVPRLRAAGLRVCLGRPIVTEMGRRWGSRTPWRLTPSTWRAASPSGIGAR